ncbi:MAG: hypothetical protein RIT81_11880 [Deltaproteobacteria bacterium]
MRSSALALFALVCTPSTVYAHLELTSPTSRYGGSVLKDGPCGMAGGGRSQNVFTFRAGETITIQWNEYINHPGHYRIAFDDDGDDAFEDPACTAGCNTRNPTVEMYNNDAVLMDGIADIAGGDYSVEVRLPDVACTNCTLQVIQVMYDKPPYTLPGNEMYYQCIDIVLVKDDPPDAGVRDGGVTTDAGTTDAATSADTGDKAMMDDGGCICVRSRRELSSLALLFVFFLLGWRARRAHRTSSNVRP